MSEDSRVNLPPAIAGVPLPARVRVARTTLSAAELAEARAAGVLEAQPLQSVELVVGGAVVATGALKEKDGKTVFTVEEIR